MAEEQSAADQVTQVVDHLTDKLGMAADKLEPLAAIIVQEFTLAHVVSAIGNAVIAVIAISGMFILRRFVSKVWQQEERRASETNHTVDHFPSLMIMSVGGIVTFAIFSLSIGMCLDNAVQAAAPHYYLLKELMG